MTTDQLFVDASLRAWKLQIDRVEASFRTLSDEQLEAPIAPGRNRLLYLLGHIAAVHDRMLPLLDIGPRRHPELDAMFIENADNGDASPIPGSALKEILVETDRELWTAFNQWSPADWLAKHTSVSDADFVKEPHRHRFSVLLSRLSHLAFHHGQIVLTEPRA
ncbi:MAG: DinB family protein [Gemmatimonadaceae bacterium]